MRGWFSQRFFIAKRYVKYLLFSKSIHSVHSPFVFELYGEAILGKKQFYNYKLAESVRASLLLSSETIETKEFGAGSNVLPSKKRRVSEMARSFAKPPKYGQLLFRLVCFFQPKKILELGTSLGISTLYLALPDSKSQVITLEGSPETSEMARKNFRKAGVKNIQVITGNFDDSLAGVLKSCGQMDFIFFDGNHRKEPTIRYFKECLPYANANSVFVFDDIHWSKEMEEAWEEIKEHSSVTTTIDLFFLGLIFFRKELSRENFVLRF